MPPNSSLNGVHQLSYFWRDPVLNSEVRFLGLPVEVGSSDQPEPVQVESVEQAGQHGEQRSRRGPRKAPVRTRRQRGEVS